MCVKWLLHLKNTSLVIGYKLKLKCARFSGYRSFVKREGRIRTPAYGILFFERRFALHVTCTATIQTEHSDRNIITSDNGSQKLRKLSEIVSNSIR